MVERVASCSWYFSYAFETRLKKKNEMTITSGTTITESHASRAFSRITARKLMREEQDDAADADRLVGVEAAQRVHIRGAALDQLAGLRLVVIAEGQPLDVVVQIVAQPARDPLGGLRGELAAEEGEEALHQRQHHEAERDREQDAELLRLPQDFVHEVAQQQGGGRLGQRADRQR